MRVRSRTPKPGQVGNYWRSKRPGRKGPDDAWYRTWYDQRSRQTCRLSIGTADFKEASRTLATWVIENDKKSGGASRDKVRIQTVLLNYWFEHAKKLPSAYTDWNGLAYWQEFWGTKSTVADITPQKQRQFR